VQKVTQNDDSSDSEDDASEDEKPKVKQIKPAPQPSAVKESASSSEDSGSDSDSDSDGSLKTPAITLKKAQLAKGSSSDADSSGEESSDSKSEEDVEMEDGTSTNVAAGKYDLPLSTNRTSCRVSGKRKAEDSPTLPSKKSKTTNGIPTDDKVEDGSTKTIFVGNLSWAVDNDRLAQEFADCGEVTSARVQLDRNTGKSRGFGYVTFATTEAVDAAISLSGTKEIDGRTLNLDKSTENGANKEKRAQAFGDVRSAPSKVLFVGNLSWSTVEDTLWDAFSEYGEVTSVRIPTDRESGKPKGYGYIEFGAVESAQKAITAMNGKDLDGRQIRLDFTQPRDTSDAGRGRGRGRGGFDGGRGRGGFDNRRGRGGLEGGRGGFDGGRGRGGGRVRHFPPFQIMGLYNL
jgi:nucleolin